jgi:hypothetical protein
MSPVQGPHQPPASVSHLRQAAAQGFFYSRSRSNANPIITLKALSFAHQNDQHVWPDSPNHLVDPVSNWPDRSRWLTPEAGKEPVA